MNQLSAFDEVVRPHRLLRYFGSELELRRCTAFQFMPDVLAYLATGVKLKRELERTNYSYFLAATAAERSACTGGSLRKATLATIGPVIAALFGASMSMQSIKALPPERRSPYRITFRARHRLSKVVRRVVVRLAAEERLSISLDRSLGTPGHAQRYGQAMGRSIVEWHLYVGQDAAIHMDRILMHIAWVDRDLCRFVGDRRQVQPLMELAAPHQHPMRTWFDGLLQQRNCTDLLELEQLLAARAVSAPHQSLRHWASGTQPLGHHRAMEILRGCGPMVNYEAERLRFWCARLLTFVQELLLSMNAESAPSQELARSLVYQRLLQLRSGSAPPLL